MEPSHLGESASPSLARYVPSESAAARAAFAASESPFVNEYHASDDETPRPLHGDAMSEIARELFADLADDELDDAIGEVVDEASDVRLQESGDDERYDAADEARVERVVRAHLEPLASDSEALVDRALELADLPGEQLEEALDDLELPSTPSPAFEQFFSALKKKLRKVAAHGLSLAKRGLSAVSGPLVRRAFGTLKAIVRPLLEKVVKLALGKVDARYRPHLRKLAEKLGLDAGIKALADRADAAAVGVVGRAPSAPASDEPASPSAAGLQEELNLELVDTLMGGEVRQEEVGDRRAYEEAEKDPLGALDAARERFIGEVATLRDDEDVQPAVERFLPAVMVALRLGIRLAGRDRVVGFLGSLIAKLIAPLAGKEVAPALGRAVADVGLKTFLHAEIDEDETRRLGAEALASTVEETVRRVATFPDHVLAEPLLFEVCTHEAFDAAAAANLPSQLLRPELRETGEPSGWVRLPLRGPKLYKKLGRVFDVRIAPHVAGTIATFDGSTLSTFFRDRLGLAVGEPVRARVHVFEAIPRTRLARIARSESVRGLGSSQRWAWSQIHPLTSEAAGLLLGAPRLGRDVEDEAEPQEPRVGERYYYLEVEEAPARPLGHASHAHVTANLAKGHLAVCLYLSEAVAQAIAAALRRKASLAAIVGELRSVFASSVQRIAHGRSRRAFRVVGVHPGGRALPPAVEAVIRSARRHVATRAFAWSWLAIARQLLADAPSFLRMADDPADGVRISVSFPLPHAADLVRAFSGDAAQAVALAREPPPGAAVHISSGPRHA